MEPYRQSLKQLARELRKNMTDAEQLLWYRIRCKQIRGIQFYRQKPLLNFIVDFYCARTRLVIELDGSQHLKLENQQSDAERDRAIAGLGLKVLRFDNQQVLSEIDSVVEVIDKVVQSRM